MRKGLLFAFVATARFIAHGQDISRFERLAQLYATNGRLEGSVLVARGDKILVNRGYNAATSEGRDLNRPETKFWLGPVTKEFTAALVLILEERGKLKTSESIRTYLPEAPVSWQKITIFNLLTHTSGIPTLPDFPDHHSGHPYDITLEGLLGKFRFKPLDFEPGSRFSPNNLGFMMLGYLVERVTGTTYSALVQEYIFDRVGMKDSGCLPNAYSLIGYQAAKVAPTDMGPWGNPDIDESIPFSAGAFYSTTGDLLRWQRELLSGKLLSAVSVKKMTTAFRNHYALGLRTRDTEGRPSLTDDGLLQGLPTQLSYYPAEDITVIILNDESTRDAAKAGDNLILAALGSPVTLPSEEGGAVVSPQILIRYVGTYENGERQRVFVTEDSGQLVAQPEARSRAGGPIFPLYPLSKTGFYAKITDLRLEFVPGANAKPDGLMLNDNPALFRRVSDSVDAPAPLIPLDILRRYAGTYRFAPSSGIFITLEGVRLWEQTGGQRKQPLFAVSISRFMLRPTSDLNPKRPTDPEIDFTRSVDGPAKGLVLRQGDQSINAVRE